MGLLNMLGRIGMDTSGLESAFNRSEKVADKFSNKLTRQVGGAVLSAFTVQRLIGWGREVIEQGVNIDRLSKKFNLTTDEVQLLQQESNRTGQSFEELVKNADTLEATLARIRGGDVLFGPEGVAQLNAANEVLQEFKNQAGIRVAGLLGLGGDGGDGMTPLQQERRAEFQAKDAERRRKDEVAKEQAQRNEELRAQGHVAMMDRALSLEKETEELNEKNRVSKLTKEERLNELLKERERLMHDERLIGDMDEASEAKARARLLVARNQSEINSLTEQKSSVRGLSPLSDSLRSVGRFGGENPNNPTVRHLTSMDRSLKNIERNTAATQNADRFPL